MSELLRLGNPSETLCLPISPQPLIPNPTHEKENVYTLVYGLTSYPNTFYQVKSKLMIGFTHTL